MPTYRYLAEDRHDGQGSSRGAWRGGGGAYGIGSASQVGWGPWRRTPRGASLGWIYRLSSPRGVFLLRRSAQALRLYAPIGRPRPFGRHRELAYLTAMPAACPSRMVRVSTFGLKASNRRRRRASSTRLHDRTPRPGGWTHLTARGGGNT